MISRHGASWGSGSHRFDPVQLHHSFQSLRRPKGRRFVLLAGRIGQNGTMTSVQVSLPDSLFAALRKAPHEVPREIRSAASIHWYQQSALSMERAAECAGLSRSEFLGELARRRVDVFVIDEEDLARELRDA